MRLIAQLKKRLAQKLPLKWGPGINPSRPVDILWKPTAKLYLRFVSTKTSRNFSVWRAFFVMYIL